MPETTAVSEVITSGTTEMKDFFAQLTQQEWFPYAVGAAVLLLVVIIVVCDPSKNTQGRCPCCESGGRVIGGVRRNDTDVWIKEAKYCPLCGKPLRPNR